MQRASRRHRHHRLVVVAALVAASLGWAGDARAHQASATYATLDATDDPARARYSIRIAARDLYEALDLPADHDASPEEIRAGRDALVAYLLERITFDADGERCRPEPTDVAVIDDGSRFARIDLDVVCPAPIHELALDYDLFFDLDPAHTGFVRVDGGTTQLRAPDDTRLVWRVGGPPPGGLFEFVRSGVHHILSGLDHILFLLSLLLMAVLARGPAGQPVIRPPRAALLYTLGIVTAFTVAHSMTLIAAALGWVRLPSRLVESVIAASIVLVAVDNALRVDPARRRVVTFVFGLMHGLGFAAMLRPLLPPDEVVLPLLAFNVGVELGQLGIVLVVMPALHALVRGLGPDRYRKVVLPVGAVILGGLGAVWLIERACDVVLLGL